MTCLLALSLIACAVVSWMYHPYLLEWMVLVVGLLAAMRTTRLLQVLCLAIVCFEWAGGRRWVRRVMGGVRAIAYVQWHRLKSWVTPRKPRVSGKRKLRAPQPSM
jgi:hypothetical protein